MGGGSTAEALTVAEREPGQAADEGVRRRVEGVTGADLSGVRIHTGAASARAAGALSAEAYTVGQDVHFGEGRYRPGTPGGDRLLAHELVHAAQQGSQPAGAALQAKGEVSQPGDPAEQEADRLADRALDGGGEAGGAAAQVTPSVMKVSRKIQREEKEGSEPSAVTGEEAPAVDAKAPPDDDEEGAEDQSEEIDPPDASALAGGGGDEGGGTVSAGGGGGDGGGGAGGAEGAQGVEANDGAAAKDGEGGQAEQAGLAIAASGAQVGSAQEKREVASEGPAEASDNKAAGPRAATENAGAPAAETQVAAQPAAEVKAPANEVESQAEARHMGGLAATAPAPFSRGAFKAALRQKIAAAAPKTLEEASNFQGNNQLGEVKSAVAAEVGKGQEQTTGPIETKNREAPDQAGIQPKPVTPLAPPEKGTPPSVPNAAAAAPKRKPDESVEMKSGPAEVDRKMAQAEVTEPQLQKSNEPKFQAAAAAKKEAKADADAGPKTYRQVEQPALAGAQAGAEALVQQQLQAMTGGREAALRGVLGQQQAAKGQDEQARAQVAQKIRQIFGVSQQKVEARLQRLDAEVNAAFDAGAAQARKQFEEHVGRRMDAYKEERYGGLVGAGSWVKDKLFGMPEEVNAFYSEGKQRYLAAMEATIDRVATTVETGLREATAEVGRGKKEVDDYVKSLPASLRQVGQQAQAEIQTQFDGLAQSIQDKQGELVDTLAQKYSDETQKLDQRVGELKAQNRGLVDKALDLVGEVLQTIKQLGEMLRNVLARAAGVAQRILADPIGFVGNLVRGAREGFSRFVANIGEHLQQGLFGWLTGALAGAGLQMPASFDLKGIFSVVSQVLNMTWQAIRTRAVRILGERAVRALEQGSEIVKLLMTGGPAAIWEHVKGFVGDLKTAVVDQIKNFVITKVVSAGVTWVLSLLNPASAFVKACKAIYDIVMFFVERAAQIADLVNAVLDSIEAVAGGAVGAMVAKIEGALVKALPVVIGFLASLLGIGGISEKVKAILQKVRGPIEKAIDWVLKKAWELLKKAGGWVKDKTGKGARGEKDSPSDTRSDSAKREDLHKAVTEARGLLEARDATVESVRAKLPAIRDRYRLTSLTLDQDSQTEYHVTGKVNPEEKTPKIPLPMTVKKAIEALHSGQKEVTVRSFPDANLVLDGAFPNAIKSRGPGPKSASNSPLIAAQVRKFRKDRKKAGQTEHGGIYYHKDYLHYRDGEYRKYLPPGEYEKNEEKYKAYEQEGLLYGHEDLAETDEHGDPHPHRTIAHINVEGYRILEGGEKNYVKAIIYVKTK